MSGRLQGYLPHRWPRWSEFEFIRFENDPIGPFLQSMPITRRGDVRIVPTPGHTPHHVSVIVEGSPSLFLAGDTSYSQNLCLARKVDGVSLSPEISLQTIDRIRNLAEERPLVYLPSHDPDAETRLVTLATLTDKVSVCVN